MKELILRLIEWSDRRRKNNFIKLLAAELKPVWLFDRGGYVWVMQSGRNIRVAHDQIGNFIVYDGTRMVSGYLKSREEGKAFAIKHIATEIVLKYYKHLSE